MVALACSLPALAQVDRPPLDTPQADVTAQDPGAAGADTEQTPAAKPSDDWTHVGGAVFRKQVDPADIELAEGSPTDFAVDFFSVDFEAEDSGIAVGAACVDPDTGWDQLAGCDRVPVIWRYSPTAAGGQPHWHEVYRSSESGYAGAVAFLSDGSAIAVGGTGEYPRRERAAGSSDQAGSARVWVLGKDAFGADEDWRELSGAELGVAGEDEPMTGLNTVDCSPLQQPFCVAGGMRQLWHWNGAEFTESFTPTSLDAEGSPEVDDGAGWRFRVRQIRFFPIEPGDNPEVVAVTSGCCDADPAKNTPRMLLYDSGRWYARLAVRDEELAKSLDDHGFGGIPRPPSAAESKRELLSRQSLPDSYYALVLSPEPNPGNSGAVSVVATPGAPSTDDPNAVEPASRIVSAALPSRPGDRKLSLPGDSALTDVPDLALGSRGSVYFGDQSGALSGEVHNPHLSSMRLHAADGDALTYEARHENFLEWNLGETGPDGIADWAVGVLRSSGQGVAYTTIPGNQPAPNPIDCRASLNNTAGLINGGGYDPGVGPQCRPREAGEIAADPQSRRLIGLPVYALNAFQFVADSSTAWAVGDRGAITRLGSSSLDGASEPDPPRVGRPTVEQGANEAAYQALAPEPGGSTSPVPARSVEFEELEHPELIPYGTPDPSNDSDRTEEDVIEIVMSRDGSEGWGIGSGVSHNPEHENGMTLHHFDGTRWTACDTSGVPGVLKPDPACAAVDPLRAAERHPTDPTLPLLAAARVPLERDADPSNDDEFEVVAIGREFKPEGFDQPATTVLRYRDGAWSFDYEAMRALGAQTANDIEVDLVFSSPSEGWMVRRSASPGLFRYEAGTWTNCAADAAGCDAAPGLFPLNQQDPFLYLTQAGERVYLYGGRPGQSAGVNVALANRQAAPYPLILHKDPGSDWTAEDGGFDPASNAETSGAEFQGELTGLSVAEIDGELVGWATGDLGAQNAMVDNSASTVEETVDTERSSMLRLEGGSWQPWTADDAVRDYRHHPHVPLTVPAEDGSELSVLMPTISRGGSALGMHPMMVFDGGRWEALPTPFALNDETGVAATDMRAVSSAITPDGAGGFWLAVDTAAVNDRTMEGRFIDPPFFYYRYTDRAPVEPFEEVPHPVRDEITGLDAAPDGTVWVSTRTGALNRYDRVTGWERLGIPGWDPGRVITRPSAALAVAVGPSGEGLAVGEGGRIAELTPQGVKLDPAAGRSCGLVGAGPCSTGYDLTSAAVAPDGSAMAGGERKALLYRPPNGEFRAISPPTAPPNAAITGISMPGSGRAFLTTSTGQLFAGTGGEGGWEWTLENVTTPEPGRPPRLLSLDSLGRRIALRAIEVDASGRGVAVGDDGLLLERSGDGDAPWARIDGGFEDNFTSVALAPGGGLEGALVGGGLGIVLTRVDGHFQVSRPSDFWDPLTLSRTSGISAGIVGIASVPGYGDGQVEAWAATQVPSPSDATRLPAPGAILHYTNAPGEPLLNPASRMTALPDVPAERPEELEVAAFGRTECRRPSFDGSCAEFSGTNAVNERTTTEIAETLTSESAPDLAVFTGDVGLAGGRDRSMPIPGEVDTVHRRWLELVGGRFLDAEVPLLGAIGGRDLSIVRGCNGSHCVSSNQRGSNVGDSGPWRRSFAGMTSPWGSGPEGRSGDLRLVPVSDAPGDAPAGAGSLPDTSPEAPGGGARTHYALDVVDATQSDQRVARIAVVDSSLGSLAASTANQNPVEDQQGWLEQALCVRGSPTDTAQRPCSREPGQRAIVVTTTPTYSYGPGALSDTATDASALEGILMRHRVDAVISGKLGWNGLYWARGANGVSVDHVPSPGGQHPDPATVPESIPGGDAPIPFLIAASGGGRFGPDGEASGSASDGFWHGYSALRLNPASGQVIVEQRPVFDWVGLTAEEHLVRPGKRVTLEGVGREVAGIDASLRYDEINSFAITHRYDLLVAEEGKPWLPAEADGASAVEQAAAEPSSLDDANPCAPYLCLAAKVATVDRNTGEARAGNGAYPRTFAVGALSVGAHSATWPLVFEPRANFGPPAPVPARPPALPPPPANPAQPPQPNPPAVEALAPPVLPNLTAATPPAPPVPPTPPPAQSQTPLDLNLAPTALDVTPPTAVSQPPTPPVNPAPPSGARREARQRQAAAQKSGADADEGSEAQELGGDLANSPDAEIGTQAATRHKHEFTALTDRDQPSAWARDALLGGGIGIAALVLALGLRTARPTPRRREPEVPAPAWARRTRR
jgi:hypothetical protein